MKINGIEIANDCSHFKGDMPCEFHKAKGMLCKCDHYKQIRVRIVIVKLGAIGDVIRTTVILNKIKKTYPNSEITWVSRYPDLIPKLVDFSLGLGLEDILFLLSEEFDILYNFDKEKTACALANLIKAKKKKGFFLKRGKCFPIDKDANHKFVTGLNDNICKANAKSYPEEIFEIIGEKFSGEKYIIDKVKERIKQDNLARPLVGLNTGCGERWKTRTWPQERWIDLAIRLREKGFGVLLLGGEIEHENNLKIKELSGAEYLGYFSLKDFTALINTCDLVVTTVTLALHIAVALEKKIILLNNIFNKNEFELYGRGVIIEPTLDCLACYKVECDKQCMELISAEKVYEKVACLLKKS